MWSLLLGSALWLIGQEGQPPTACLPLVRPASHQLPNSFKGHFHVTNIAISGEAALMQLASQECAALQHM